MKKKDKKEFRKMKRTKKRITIQHFIFSLRLHYGQLH